jgi:N-acylneuraminate cytidylyltransferase
VNVAIIPARGGSKRIPRKNVLPFDGKPVIAWSIEAARASGCFDRIVVSTDDDEVAEVAARFGAEVPFRRPAELATDHMGTIPVIAHAVEWLGAHGPPPALACCIYATAPLLVPDDLRSCRERLERTGADYAFTCTTFPYPIQRALHADPAGRIAMFHPEYEGARSQDLAEVFHDAGQFYWGRAQAWLEGRRIFGPGSIPFMIPRWRVQDIDTPEDWARAELLHRLLSACDCR